MENDSSKNKKTAESNASTDQPQQSPMPSSTSTPEQSTQPMPSSKGVFLMKAKGQSLEEFKKFCVKRFREAGLIKD